MSLLGEVRRSGRNRLVGSEAVVSPAALALALVAVAFLAVAVVWPRTAETLLRALLVILALSAVAIRVYRAGLPERTTHDGYSPFDGPGGERPRSRQPRVIQELAGELAAVDDPERARTTRISWRHARVVASEISRGLAERRGLRLARASDRPRIRALLSDPAWRLVTAEGLDAPPEKGVLGEGPDIPLSDFHTILDDLEKL